MKDVRIYHNPACSTSRNALALLRGAGIEPEIVEYLKEPLSKATLRELAAATGGSIRPLLRAKEAQYQALSLDDPKWSEEELLDFVARYPILLNRPIVVTPHGTRLCRPSESVLDLLPEKS
ncbi:MAG TPA: arsenate reductase (glutaredoxin) [Candidatus Limnocylindrales bacterium]|nr:arsenate reductase (glutaredoxin) [Candidatus Limnocylindrales bacterium]